MQQHDAANALAKRCTYGIVPGPFSDVESREGNALALAVQHTESCARYGCSGKSAPMERADHAARGDESRRGIRGVRGLGPGAGQAGSSRARPRRARESATRTYQLVRASTALPSDRRPEPVTPAFERRRSCLEAGEPWGVR